MDEGDSESNTNPPLYHRLKWIGRSLYLRE